MRPISSYEIRELVSLYEYEVAYRCAELEDKGYLVTSEIQSSLSQDVSPTIVVKRITSYGRDYVLVVSNPKRWPKVKKWMASYGLPAGQVFSNLIFKLFESANR